MMKRFIYLVLTVVVAVGILGACGTKGNTTGSDTKKSTGGSYVPKSLTVGFVPSQNADTLEAKAKPLGDLLSKQLGIPVKVTVTTDYNSIIAAMKSKNLDLGFLPPTAYVLAHQQGAANVLLQAERYGVNPANGKATSDLVDYYYALMLVKKNSGINSVSDLKGKKIAWQDPTSSAGYVWPAVYMKDHGVDAQKDVTGVQVQGHDKAIEALMNGDVDAAAVFSDARNIVSKEYPDIWNQTKVLFQTAKIPNDTISVRPDMSADWQKKIQDAFVAIGNDPKGKKIIESIYTHEGYAKSNDSKFDIVRDYSKKVTEIGQ